MFRLLSIFAVVGVLIAPMAPPSAAGMDIAKSSVVQIHGDMHCCLHNESEIPDCGKTCPMAVLCASACILSLAPSIFVASAPEAMAGQVAWTDEVWRNLLAYPPPSKPPRV